MDNNIKDNLGIIMDGVCRALKVLYFYIYIFKKKSHSSHLDKNRAGFSFATRYGSVQNFKSHQIL